VIGFALDRETRRHVDEQVAWIAREPANAEPYYNLAQLFRLQEKPAQEALRTDEGERG
jgi:hypothetical protein